MTDKKPYPLILGILLLAIVCMTPVSSWSQDNDNAVEPATQGPDPAYGNCPAPTQSGVSVCSPAKYQAPTALASPFQVIASATGGRGEVKRIELWADGSKLLEVGGNVLNQPVTLPQGSHEITLVEVDSTGFYVKSDHIQLDIWLVENESCDPPPGPGVHVCEPPQPNGCHTSPWSTIVAAGTGVNGPVVRMELWLGNVKIANFPGNRINTNLELPDYRYATIVAVDSKGGFVKSPPFLIWGC
jgi:hypothetical protein